ncbi:tetratricopeptide repeat protein [Streptomyces sp. ISL-98]|uniref:tetratricopeptide repeat protein n=1 Tax=Streptomyces sp. ISL-98 TaxID=2819192 RepID=UPI001BE73F66|nr:tetratricopeptide repeat protein [Streptomyces sp. ISL-98]MBT2506925.1 tetratricopeptide repeat protein [Streptomyces sp. ISL-98]
MVWGMAGCGKTAVVQTVFAEAVRDGSVVGLWVNASGLSSFRSGMLAVAHDRGASQDEVDAARTGRRPAADFVWDYLNRSSQPWLLVLDNADDPEVFRDGLWLRTSPRGIVLVTSRHGSAPVWRAAAKHPLDVLKIDDAVDVLRDLTVNAEEQAKLELLASRLGCHPLALSLAGAYLGRQLLESVTVDEYLKRLDVDPSFIDRGAEPGEQDLSRLISSTWQLSLDALAERGTPEATTLLRLISCYAPDPLPAGLLLPAGLDATGLSDADPPLRGEQANRALEGLLSHALVSLLDAPVGPQHPTVRSVQAHPLLLETVAARIPVDQRGILLSAAAGLLRGLLATNGEQRIDPHTLRLFTPHAIHLLRRTTRERVEVQQTALTIVRDLRDRAYDCNDFFAAQVLALEAVRMTRSVVSAEALTDLHEQGRALSGLGRFAEAVEAHSAALRDRQELLGTDHRGTLDSAYALGLALYGLGRWAEDEQCMRRATEGRERVLGPGHPDTIDARSCLAEAIGQQRRWQEARELATSNLRISQEVLGSGDRHTLTARIALAWVLAGIGRWQEAEAHTRETLLGCAQALGEDHPRTLAARQRLADVLSHLEQWPEAEAAARSVRAVRQRSLGEEHPHTLSVEILLSRILRCRGALVEARHQATRVLEACVRVLGDAHPDTGACRRELRAATEALARACGDTDVEPSNDHEDGRS